jgi:TetR/AcrR family fatty acid metabolism transcriptional regulator
MEKKLKRNRMIEAAFTLFLKNGYANTKVIDIADEAGVGKGTVYEYFPSKEQLFAEVFKLKVLSDYSVIGKLIQSKMTAEEKLVKYVEFEAKNMRKFGDSLHMLPELVMSTDAFKNEAMQKIIYDLWVLRFNAMHTIIKEGMASGEFLPADSELTAMSVMGSLNFFLLFKYDMMPKACPKVVDGHDWEFQSFAQTIFNGIRRRP